MNKGFTLVEIIVAISIVAIFGAIVIFSFWSLHTREALLADSNLIRATLSQARSRTISGTDAIVYGVHFGNTEITLFRGSSYDSNESTNTVYDLNRSIYISSISLAGGGDSVVFKKISGETDESGTVTISKNDDSVSSTITIYPTGVVK